MTFIPDFDLTKYQRLNPPSDGRFHVHVKGIFSKSLYEDLSFETEEEARVAATKGRNADAGAGAVVYNPDWALLGIYLVQHLSDDESVPFA